ncbi:MAG: type II 3-dehydroquinate dehydratase [Paramuribaculum sp.]|nr:type II 3-dehydroquinate dehydratase [Paramuribaculum sp.]
MNTKKILILNGPNLNLLGRREPHVYGSQSMEQTLNSLRTQYPELEIEYAQSNHEGTLIDTLHQVGFDPEYVGVVLNAGAYTHTSLALADAIRAIDTPVIEVHISNVWSREDFRHHSFLSPACKGVIAGFGMSSYRLAIEALLS